MSREPRSPKPLTLTALGLLAVVGSCLLRSAASSDGTAPQGGPRRQAQCTQVEEAPTPAGAPPARGRTPWRAIDATALCFAE